jgi:hypothetical protein
MSSTATRERSGCLTAWLILMLIANSGLAFYYLTSGNDLARFFTNASPTVFIILAVLGAVNVASAIALWRWKKWGFYLFIGTAILSIIINLSLGIPLFNSLLGLVGVGILWYLLNKQWDQFE